MCYNSHHGTWGSHEGEEIRARVLAAFGEAGAAIAGDVAADLAETLVRIAMGDSPDEVIPEPGEIAFDLVLDALTPFVPGGGRVTRELGAAVKRRNPSKGYYSALERGIVSENTLEQNAKFANELFPITDQGFLGEAGKRKGFDEYTLPIPRLTHWSFLSGWEEARVMILKMHQKG